MKLIRYGNKGRNMRTPQESQDIIDALEKEIASLKGQLKREQDTVDYYSLGDVEGDIYLLPGDDIYYEQFRIGKLARSTQARREK